MNVEKLSADRLHILTELFQYNNVDEMMENCSRDIKDGAIDIFVMYDNGALIGELRVKYKSDDENFAVYGRRAYLYAFRVKPCYQGKGYGTALLNTVLKTLKEKGYTEATVGVEDDNPRGFYMYQKAGFDKLLLRKSEEYQGDSYEYNLYLKNLQGEKP